MRETTGSRLDLDVPGDEVLLPAEALTIGASLRGKPILVAHTGQAHLGLVVNRRLRRQLARALASARVGRPATVLDEVGFEPRRDVPEVIHFRYASAHEVVVREGQVVLVLHATDAPRGPDVHVELCLTARPAHHGAARRRHRR